jgi:hypothetical protein
LLAPVSGGVGRDFDDEVSVEGCTDSVTLVCRSATM